MDEIVYMIADNDYDGWTKGRGDSTIKKNGVYKGKITGGFIKEGVPELVGDSNFKGHGWNCKSRPFREINKIEAFILSRGNIKWLP